MLMLKVKCNILNYYKSEGLRDSYVKMLNYVQFRKDWRNSLWTFPCDICTYSAIHLLLREIWRYPPIFSNVNIFMTVWKKIWYTSESLNLQQYFDLIFLCVFQIKTVSYSFFLMCICCYRRNFITPIFSSKDELILYLLVSVLDR